MANVEWAEIPFTLTSLQSDGVTQNTQFIFNAYQVANALGGPTLGPQAILDPEKCQAGSAKRVTRDNTPQHGGEIMHRHFKTGFVMQIGGFYANVVNVNQVSGQPNTADYVPLCGSSLVALDDLLMLNLDAMENVNGSLAWVPSGYPKTIGPTVQPGRAVYDCRWLGPDGLGGAAFTAVLTQREDQVFVGFQFAIVTPFPYAVDASETDTNFTSATPQTLTNYGTTGFSPVIEVQGPTSYNGALAGGLGGDFVIYNHVNGQFLLYDSTLPGASSIPGGQHIEFDFFRNTAYFNGSGASAKAGINIAASDFWEILPGGNSIEIDGTTMTVKWQSAYV